MEIGAQLARPAITATQKFKEAAFFYDQMYACRTNVEKFPFFLSAFLTSFRSITIYLQKQYAHDDRFKEWYPVKQAEMEKDPTLALLNKRRNAVTKREPFDLYFKHGYKMPQKYGDFIETTHFELEVRQDDGWLRMRIKAGPDSDWEKVEPWVEWWFRENDDTDVMNLCHAGLDRMDAILKQLAELRIGIGLPADEEMPGSLDDIPVLG